MANSLSATVKRRFLTGLFVAIPGVITVLVMTSFFRFVDGLMEPFYFRLLGDHYPGLGFLSALIIIFIIGIISTNVFGKRIIQFVEFAFMKMPVVKGFYTAIKHLVDAFSPDNKSVSFSKFVIIEYPRKGCFAFGFLTKECTVKYASEEESCLKAVYIPTNNLYLGEIVLLSEKEIFYTDIAIEDGIKIILSGGIAAPHIIAEAGH